MPRSGADRISPAGTRPGVAPLPPPTSGQHLPSVTPTLPVASPSAIAFPFASPSQFACSRPVPVRSLALALAVRSPRREIPTPRPTSTTEQEFLRCSSRTTTLRPHTLIIIACKVSARAPWWMVHGRPRSNELSRRPRTADREMESIVAERAEGTRPDERDRRRRTARRDLDGTGTTDWPGVSRGEGTRPPIFSIIRSSEAGGEVPSNSTVHRVWLEPAEPLLASMPALSWTLGALPPRCTGSSGSAATRARFSEQVSACRSMCEGDAKSSLR